MSVKLQRTGGSVEFTNDVHGAFDDVDVVYAKSWGGKQFYGDTDKDIEHRAGLRNDWIVDEAKMSRSNNAIFMHCLPVRRNVIVTDSVIDSANSVVIDEAENRLHIQKAIMRELINRCRRLWGAKGNLEIMNNETLDLLREALPYIQRFQGKTFVVKFSGKVTEDKDNLASLAEELALLHQVGIRVCVIHGGGKQLTELAKKLGVVQTVIEGRRVTDDDTLDLAKMIFRGKINTEILAQFRRRGV